jgi:hypothetical protein
VHGVARQRRSGEEKARADADFLVARFERAGTARGQKNPSSNERMPSAIE